MCSALLQHVVFAVCRLIDMLVPDIPVALELKIKRERYLAKQALADSDTIMKVIKHLTLMLTFKQYVNFSRCEQILHSRSMSSKVLKCEKKKFVLR